MLKSHIFKLLFFIVFSQSLTVNAIEKNSISGNILGTGSYIGLSYERLIFQHINLEFGLGLIGYGTGITYYPNKIETATIRPYTGIKFTSHAIVDGEHKSVYYIPFGITLFTDVRLNLGFDFGPAYVIHHSPGYMPSLEELNKYPYNNISVFGNFKLGIRF